MDIKGIIVTLYDRKENQLAAPMWSAKGIATPGPNDLIFETPRFPKYWYRSIRASKYLTYYTSELSVPEIGGDSAMEMEL